MSKELTTLDDVLAWMLKNRSDYEAMDEINRTSYAYMGNKKDF